MKARGEVAGLFLLPDIRRRWRDRLLREDGAGARRRRRRYRFGIEPESDFSHDDGPRVPGGEVERNLDASRYYLRGVVLRDAFISREKELEAVKEANTSRAV